MKKVAFISLLFLSLCSSSLAQKNLKPKTEEEIAALFCHTWQLVASDEGRMRMPPPLKSDFTRLVLKSDGTCIKTKDGEEIACKWMYKPKYMVLLIEDKIGTTMYELMTLTEKEFTYKVKIGGYYSNNVMQRVEE